jgi:hypothetical protein
MSDRRENSVLFSLKELRRLEDDRVRKEQDDRRSRAEAEQAARDAAAAASRAEAERIRLAEEERVRRARAEQEAREREEQLRLQEAERRARVEGEMRLNEERMRLEIQHKAKNSPVKAVVSVAAVIVIIAGGVGYRMYSKHQEELAVEKAERARLEAAKNKAEAEYKAQMAAIQKDMNEKLAKAQNEEERARIRADALARAQAVNSGGSRSGGAKSHGASAKSEKDSTPAPTPKGVKVPGKHEISNDPLEGLSGL